MNNLLKVLHQLTRHVKLLQKAALVEEGKVLILKRSDQAKSRPACWDLPGGNSEWPASGQESAANLHQADIAREIAEETGLIVPAKYFQLKHLVHFSTFYQQDKQVFTIICGWQVASVAISHKQKEEGLDLSAVKLSTEHTQAAWVGLSDLTAYDFGGQKGQFVVDIIRQALNNS